MTWDDMQIEMTDPASSYGWAPFQIVVANVGTAISKVSIWNSKALITENLEVRMNLTDIQDAGVHLNLSRFSF